MVWYIREGPAKNSQHDVLICKIFHIRKCEQGQLEMNPSTILYSERTERWLASRLARYRRIGSCCSMLVDHSSIPRKTTDVLCYWPWELYWCASPFIHSTRSEIFRKLIWPGRMFVSTHGFHDWHWHAQRLGLDFISLSRRRSWFFLSRGGIEQRWGEFPISIFLVWIWVLNIFPPNLGKN